ncbi:MAG: hypothetical protein JWM61_2686 [Micrococcaceae bacterium]|nr:hypothetical protein [Micrococcaceae bacterium]
MAVTTGFRLKWQSTSYPTESARSARLSSDAHSSQPISALLSMLSPLPPTQRSLGCARDDTIYTPAKAPAA